MKNEAADAFKQDERVVNKREVAHILKLHSLRENGRN